MLPIHDDTPTRKTPYITWGAMFLCLAGFLWTLGLTPRGEYQVIYNFGAIPALLTTDAVLDSSIAWLPEELKWLTPVTSLFLHGNWGHLLGNLLFLYIFGGKVEEATGRVKFLLFYLLAGLAAVGAHIALDPDSRAPLIGASGAIGGVLGAYLLLYPRARILVFLIFIPVRLPAFLVLGGWFVYQFYALSGGGDEVTAWMAHIGGFLAGMVMIPFLKARHVRLFNPPVPTGDTNVSVFRKPSRFSLKPTGRAPWARHDAPQETPPEGPWSKPAPPKRPWDRERPL